MVEDYAGFMDVLSLSAQQDTCLVLPSLRHAIELWPKYREALTEVHNGRLHRTKTGVALFKTKTLLRLWVPYERDPTMPMDWPRLREDFAIITPYPRNYFRDL